MSAPPRPVVTRLVAITPLLERAAATLPEPISVNVNGSGVSVLPHLPGAPVSALLAWAEQLTTPAFTARRPDRFTTTEVQARGHLDGEPIEVVAFVSPSAAAPLAATPESVPVTEAALRAIAAAETHLVALTPTEAPA